MNAAPLNFDQWRALVFESPERAAEHFLERLDGLAPVNHRALIAQLPDKVTLIQSIKSSCSFPEQPLAGIPYMLQDLFDVGGLPTGCGAPFQSPFEGPLDDSCLLSQKLNALGGCFFAKTVPSEFGVNLRGRNPAYGDSPHPNGPHFVGGGGAGASARAVADGVVPLAFGLDTLGGVRIPAAFQGLFGFRMGANAYARDGVFPIAPSIDSVGWVNNNLGDLRRTFQAFYNLPEPLADETLRGYLLPSVQHVVSPEISAGLQYLARELKIDEDPGIGRELRHQLRDSASALDVIEARELYTIHQYWTEEYRSDYDPLLLEQIEKGMDCTAMEAEQADRIQENVRTVLTQFFHTYDYLILPITTRPSPKNVEWTLDLEHEIRRLIAPASIAFLPSLILPMHFEDKRHSAAQILLNPHKVESVLGILDRLQNFYSE